MTRCLNCGHVEDDHVYIDPEGHTEPSPCVAIFGRFKMCGCLRWAPYEEEAADAW